MATDQAHYGNGVVGHIDSVLQDYKTTRKPLEDKWNRNYAHYRRDRSLIGSHKTDNPAPTDTGAKKPKAPISFDVTTQKITTAVSIIGDVYFKGGRLPFMLSDDSLPSEVQDELAMLPEGDERRAALEERIAAVQENENLIHRQNEEADAAEVLETVVLAGAVYGKMYVKWFLKTIERDDYEEVAPGVMMPVTVAETVPAIAYKSPWGLYHDYAVPLRESESVIEVDDISLLDLERMKSTVDGASAKVIRDILNGSCKTEKGAITTDDSAAPIKREMSKRNQTLVRWQFWGYIPQDKVQQALREMGQAADAPEAPADVGDGYIAPDVYQSPVYCHAMIVEGKLVKLAETEPREMPYYDADWQKLIDGMGAVSVADNVEAMQTVLDKAVESLVEMTHYISKFILAGKRRLLQGDFTEMEHGLFLDLDEDAADVRQAVQQLVFNDNTAPMMNLIQTFISFADYSSNVPRAEQGQQAENAQTAFELKSRLERSGKYLGSVIRRLDELVEKVINRHYRYNQINPENNIAKGNYRVRAVGFSSFENKWDRVGRLINILMMILQNEDLKAISKIRYLFEEILKAEDVDPDQILKSPSELMAEADQREQQLMAQEQALQAQGGGTPADQEAIELRRAQIERLRAEAYKKTVEAEELKQAGMVKRAEVAAKIQAMTPPASAEATAGRPAPAAVAAPAPVQPQTTHPF
jgi:hypothetical protein